MEAMNENQLKLLDESIKLEHNVAELYLSFHNAFPEDSGFWWKLALEEKNHAALLESGRQYFMNAGLFPKQILDKKLKSLVEANNRLRGFIEKHKTNAFSRESAFHHALNLEKLSGEIHFQRIMEKEAESKAVKIFKILNKDDKDHADRIRQYMEENGIGSYSTQE